MTRAQVQADLAQAKNDGVVTFGNLDYPPQQADPPAPPRRSRKCRRPPCTEGRAPFFASAMQASERWKISTI